MTIREAVRRAVRTISQRIITINSSRYFTRYGILPGVLRSTPRRQWADGGATFGSVLSLSDSYAGSCGIRA